jgi:hypothetical protein
VISKLDFLVIAGAVASGAILIEQHHRVMIDPPVRAEVAARASSAVCPRQ